MTASLPRLRPLLARLNDLKRVRTPAAGGRTLAQRGFARAWAALAAGADPAGLAAREAAAAAAAVELAGVDAAVLRAGGLSGERVEAVIGAAVRAAGRDLDDAALAPLLAAVPAVARGPADGPETADSLLFVARLIAQPRAGATHPTKPRLILEPPESHADHCYLVAVCGVLLADRYGADPAVPFLAGLSHHLHNARLPDAGYAGEALLGADLDAVTGTFTEAALAELPAGVRERVRAARAEALPFPDNPAARAFHAADVIDRVLEVVHYERVGRFRAGHALDELELVHPGPHQLFLNGVLAEAGLP